MPVWAVIPILVWYSHCTSVLDIKVALGDFHTCAVSSMNINHASLCRNAGIVTEL